MKYILIGSLLAVACSVFDSILHPKHLLQLNVYFGVPGSGKTTYAAFLAKKALYESKIIRLCKHYPNRFTDWILTTRLFKRSLPVWSNVPIKGTYKLNAKTDLGIYMIEDGKLIIDEAGVEFNNRDYKAFPKTAIKFFKYHRHYGISVDVFSQSFEDMDVTIRRLAQNFYVVKKSLIPCFIKTQRVFRRVGVDKQTHQLTDQYFFGFPILDTRWIFCPPLWKMFNSYNTDNLPGKDWEYWNDDEMSGAFAGGSDKPT